MTKWPNDYWLTYSNLYKMEIFSLNLCQWPKTPSDSMTIYTFWSPPKKQVTKNTKWLNDLMTAGFILQTSTKWKFLAKIFVSDQKHQVTSNYQNYPKKSSTISPHNKPLLYSAATWSRAVWLQIQASYPWL